MSKLSHQCVSLDVPGLTAHVSLYVHGERDRFVSQRLREQGVWEPYESELVLSLLQPGDVFVDVGANIGYFSVLAATRVGGSGRVYAFEPDADNYCLLCASVHANGFDAIVQTEEAGLADYTGTATLYLSADNLGDHQIFATDEHRAASDITLLHGSEFLGARVSRVDLVKIDTQGSEYAVVKGLMPLLRSQSEAPALIVELTPLSLRQGGASGRALIELLAQLRQPLWIIDHVAHRLVASSAAELAQWCDDVDAVPGDAGFMNILVGQAP